MCAKRFDLNTLPECGAKTRSGEPCKRKGCKENGRCRLHGGKSTGAKTAIGKAASKYNALYTIPEWLLGTVRHEWIKHPLFSEAILCSHQLIILTAERPINYEAINALVAQHVVALEVMKYAVLEVHGINDFLVIQAALDHYYQDTNSAHIDYHIYYPLISIPLFQRVRSKPQDELIHQIIGSKDPIRKSIAKFNKRDPKMRLNYRDFK